MVRALLITLVLALACCAAPAVAHETDDAGNTVYVGTGCGGHVGRWIDCFVQEGYQYQPQPGWTATLVFREYAHYKLTDDGRGWRLVYYGWRFVSIY